MTDDKTYDPRVTLHNIETGEATPVEADLVQGLDEFSNAWEPQVETPSPLMFEAWQMSDDRHPPGAVVLRIASFTRRCGQSSYLR